MKVVLCSDSKYYTQSLITAISVIENSKLLDENFKLYIITDKLDEVLYRKINNYYGKDYIEPILTNYGEITSMFKKFAERDRLPLGHPFAYLKMLIPEIFKEEMDNILYLDSDILVLRSLVDLLNISIKCLGAVNNINNYNHETQFHHTMLDGRQREQIDYDIYFNSGVLLLNPVYWRKYNISKKLLNNTIDFPDRFCDQDAINSVLRDSITELPLSYNVKTNFWFNDTIQEDLHKIVGIENILYDPHILHYATKQKPWNKVGWVGPYKIYHDKFTSIVGENYSLSNIVPNKHKGITITNEEILSRFKNYTKPKMKCLIGLDNFNN